MESWQYDLDRILTTPPEIKSHFHCDGCDDFFLPDDEVYVIEGEKLCEECAHKWLKNQKVIATEEDCYD